MKLADALLRLRDDLKAWVTANLLAVEEAIKNKKDFSGKYSDLTDAPDITNNSKDELLLTDQYGNAILQVNEQGLNTTEVKTKKLTNDSDELLITDNDGNAILQVSEQGLNTTEVKTNKLVNDSNELLITDVEGNAILAVDKDGINTTEVKTKKLKSDSDEVIIVDTAGNTILKVDDKGVKTTEVSVNTISDEAQEFIVADEEGNTILQVNKDGVKTTEISASKLKDESAEVIVTDPEGNTILQVDKNGVKTTEINAKKLTDNEKELAVVDSDGNTIVKLDGSGLETTKVILNNAGTKTDIGEELLDLALNKADNTDVHVEEIPVELGTDGTVGGYKTGDVIAAGTDIKTILNKLFQKAVPATYTKPTLTLAAKSTAAGSYEYGTNITAQVAASFTKNDAGALASITILKDDVEILTGAASPLTSTAETISLTATTSYTATAAYAEGAIKNNNLGEPSPDGHISAGSIVSSAVKFTPYRAGYFYGVLDTDNSTALTSDIIRGGTMKNGAYAAGNLPLIKASSVANRKRIFVACPASNKGITKVIMPSAVNADCTANFVKQATTVSVEGANGSAGIAYNVWVYEPAEISDDQTFTVTLG